MWDLLQPELRPLASGVSRSLPTVLSEVPRRRCSAGDHGDYASCPDRLERRGGGVQRRTGRHHVIDQQDGEASQPGVASGLEGANGIGATTSPRELCLGPGGAGAAQRPAHLELEESRQGMRDFEGLIEATRELPAPVQRHRRDQIRSRQFASRRAGDEDGEVAPEVGETVILEMPYHRVEWLPVEIGCHQSVEGGWLSATSPAAVAGRNKSTLNGLGADMAGEPRARQSTSTGDTESQLGTPG